MSGVLTTLAFCVIVAGCVEWATSSRSMDYEEIRGDPYPCQMTVTEYPGLVLRLFGVESDKTVYVSRDWVYHYGWYRIPDMKQLDVVGSMTTRFHQHIRQLKYTEGRGP